MAHQGFAIGGGAEGEGGADWVVEQQELVPLLQHSALVGQSSRLHL